MQPEDVNAVVSGGEVQASWLVDPAGCRLDGFRQRSTRVGVGSRSGGGARRST
jgi:hypothetical protein